MSRSHRWLIALIAVALTTLVAARREPCVPAAGTMLAGDAPTTVTFGDSGVFRLALLNMHGGKGDDGVRDLTRTAEQLRGAQLTALNEVHGPCFWPGVDQAETLGKQLGLRWLFAPATKRWFHYQFGNGVLSSLDVTAWQTIPLPHKYGKSPRNLLLLTTQIEGRPLHVLITHIDRSDDRDRTEQMRVAGELFLSLAEPAVLMGDMNTTGDDPVLRRLRETPGVQDPLATVLGERTPRRIDWILTRGLVCVDAGLQETDVSDHPYSWADCRLVEWNGEPPTDSPAKSTARGEKDAALR